ncbi:MAG: EF-P lysine aminoacylase EpmA [Hyphomicrobiaceae bacterium]
MSDRSASPHWMPDRHEDRRARLLARSRIIAALRDYFAGEGFVEVETSALQVSPGNETHLHGIGAPLRLPDGGRQSLFLRTSPEFALKKLLAAGEPRLVEFARVFRDRERGPLHHPEFTLIEWYRAGEPVERLIEDCARVLAIAARCTGIASVSYRGRLADPLAAPKRLSVLDAFQRHAGIALEELLPDRPDALARFKAAAGEKGIRTGEDDNWSDVFSRVLTALVEPRLGEGRATVLIDYPVSEAALARARPSDPRLAERFELYLCGVELANAFGELTDPAEQRRRFEADMAEKARIYGERYPIDEDFLDALTLMPAASGIALGLDRLVMLATGARHIEDVIWDPLPRPDRQ